MTKTATELNVHTIGLDIAKNSFSVHGFDADGKTVLTKELKRGQLLFWFAKLAPCTVGLEACASAHHWGREIAKLGHDVKLVPAQRVKAFVPRMKNDAADAKAIARACREPELRFVAVKSIENQSVLMLFKARDLLTAQRTQAINALRGHFAEVGIVVPKGAHEAKALVELVLQEDEGQGLPATMRAALTPLVRMLLAIEAETKVLNAAILKHHKASETSMRLATVPGIGTLTAAVLTATVSDPKAFSGGREFAAWIGLVPRQHSTGGKPSLGKISKMGNRDLRRLLFVGATAALARIKNAPKNATGKTVLTSSPLADWARSLLAKRPFRLVAAALANKMARIAWAIMAGDDCYNPHHVKPAS
jgi:transposase